MVGTSTELRLSPFTNYSLLQNETLELPPEVTNFLRQNQIDDRIESPDDLRDLMQTLNQTGGDLNGLPRPNFQNLGNMTGQDLTQMLVDWIQSGGPEANKKITRPAPIGNLSSAGNYTSQPTSWSGGGSTTSGATTTAPVTTTAGTTASTGSTPAGGATEPTGGPTGASEARGKTFPTKEEQTAAFIDDRLEGGNGQAIVEAGQEHNVDPLVLAALTEHEAEGGDSLEGPTMIDEIESPENAIADDARQFADLRRQGGASADDPIQEQLRAVNSARGTNQDNWLQGVTDRYQDIKPAATAFRKDNPVLDTNTVQGAAQALLDSPNVSFWNELSTGSDESILQQLAQTGKADVPITGDTVVPKLEMMQALVEMAKQGPIMINALTGGEHSDGSNHYSGTAVDLDIGVGDAAQIEAIAGQFGGVRNYETSHIHIDF